VDIVKPFGFPITNSMIVSWITAVGLIIFARYATRDMKSVPGGAQNLLEWLVEGLYNFLEGIIGPHLAVCGKTKCAEFSSNSRLKLFFT
jgi:F-type H+-transporting ATPase subunit a